MLPLLAEFVDNYLTDAREMLATVTEGKEKPHVFNDQTVDRIMTLYTETLELAGVYQRHLERWRGETTDPVKRAEIDRLLALLPDLNRTAQAILDIAQDIRKGTIDRVMELDDLTLGLAALTGKGFIGDET